MQVLVTGASGFIGGHVLRLLHHSPHDVVGFDWAQPGPVAHSVTDNIELIHGDIRDPGTVFATVNKVNPDVIIHLAAVLVSTSRKHPRTAFTVNVRGTLNVLEAATTLDVQRVIAGSSVNVYGTGPPGSTALTEHTPRNPNSTYALTKYVTEELGNTYDIEFAAVEAVHGFGPDRIMGNAYDASILKAAVSGTPITVPRTGIEEEFLYVEDSARAFVTLATTPLLSHSRYLAGTDQRATLTEFVGYVMDTIPDASVSITNDPTTSTWADDRNSHPPTKSTRITDETGWTPRYTLPEMITEYADWLQNNQSTWSFTTNDIPWTEPQ